MMGEYTGSLRKHRGKDETVMKCWWLIINLKSDMCAATGGSDNGLIDSKTALEYGMPIIQAKRLKGCLLNEAKEMASNGFAKAETLDHLFGKIGSGNPGSLHLGDAHLYRVPGSIFESAKLQEDVVIDEYEQVLEEIQNHPSLNESLIEDVLTRSRTRTAIDRETKTAQSKTLRTMQVVPRGMVLKSRVELREPEIADEEKLLKHCVKALRHIGLGVTRGFGEISCSLEEIVSEDTKWNTVEKLIPSAELQSELNYEIRLNAPALFAGEAGMYEDCCEQIPGSALMGAFAGMYIKDWNLGSHAHQDETFRRIFLRDGVQFGYGFLKKEEKIFYPCPASVVQEKNRKSDDKKTVMNRIPIESETVRRKDIGNQVCIDIANRTLYLADVEKEVRMHHARPVDRGIGHALNDRFEPGAADMGQFFQYTALSKGQRFCGTLKGQPEDLSILLECVKKQGFRLSLGRSRTAEYGEAEIRCFANRNSQNEKPSKRWLLWLLTPMVLVSDWGRIELDLEYLKRQMKGLLRCEIEIKEKESILKSTRVAGYNSKWGLPMPQYAALSAGTVLSVEAGRELYAAELEGVRWGEMVGRGYGQIKTLPENLIKDDMRNYTVKEAACENVKREVKSSLITALLAEVKSDERIRKEMLEALPIEVPLPNMATISKLIRLLENGTVHTYEEMVEYVNQISGWEKKKSVLEFLKPCEKKPEEFIKAYLDSCKWRLRRGEGVNHDRSGQGK